MDMETISGVPFTGWLKTTRPTTSATTRKLNRNASKAEKASRELDTNPLILLSIYVKSEGSVRTSGADGAGEDYLMG